MSLLEDLRAGKLDIGEAVERLRLLPYESVGEVARVDHHRSLRSGAPEVVFGEGKSAEDIARVMAALDRDGAGALATRVSRDKADVVLSTLGRGRYDVLSRIAILEPATPRQVGRGSVAVVCAGTSDRPVAEEAAVTLEFLGHEVRRVTDVGVAGLHRVLSVIEDVRKCEVAIVVAGMEGALPTVVAGLVESPVIAVPTSIGYGVAQAGFAALLGMLSSCAAGLTVVNVDNGFGAAIAASRMNRRRNA